MENDVGTAFRITIRDCETTLVVDLSAATIKQIIFTKPSGTKVTQTATYFTDGTDGIIYYATVDGDLNEVGVWQMQAYVEIGGSKWYTDVKTFRVGKNL